MMKSVSAETRVRRNPDRYLQAVSYVRHGLNRDTAEVEWSLGDCLYVQSNPSRAIFEVSAGYGNSLKGAIKIIEMFSEDLSHPLTDEQKTKCVRKASLEWRLMQNLRGQSHIVQIWAHATVPWRNGDCSGQDLVILMEYLPQTLADTIEDGHGPYDENRIIAVGLDLCEGLLQCATASMRTDDEMKHILHRDVKPANIFYDKNGKCYKLGDFGISRLLADGENAPTAVATMPYAAPERLRHQPYDSRADIYSVGIILFRMCNDGALPYAGLSQEKAMIRRCTGPLPEPAHGSAALCEVIARATAVRPEDRYQNVADLRQALQYAQHNPQGHVEKHPVQERPESSEDVFGEKRVRLRQDGGATVPRNDAAGETEKIVTEENSNAVLDGSTRTRLMDTVPMPEEKPTRKMPNPRYPQAKSEQDDIATLDVEEFLHRQREDGGPRGVRSTNRAADDGPSPVERSKRERRRQRRNRILAIILAVLVIGAVWKIGGGYPFSAASVLNADAGVDTMDAIMASL
ncbi:hypothetical protein EP30_07815 [Bifidobacterium sp. UTCIF-39]|uniref:serine/threonine-protein kinase n=1 Tax=Bifidobacterium sp. UTCIF-39 TaxID=1465359 RepID=UPI001128765B|nr:serine/threonine-protein kinase [Bifidobacterium sp. UTCIF-39]TPF96426.1 hypothetical protein EP30_07815 [Bifidobacterium sp. UTCIF-39]